MWLPRRSTFLKISKPYYLSSIPILYLENS